MHTVFALLCFVVVIHWPIFPYPSGLLHWHCGNVTIAPVPAKQPWWIWINTSCEFIMNHCITTTKQSTTKLCAYFLGYTVISRAMSPQVIWWDFSIWRHTAYIGNKWFHKLMLVYHFGCSVRQCYVWKHWKGNIIVYKLTFTMPTLCPHVDEYLTHWGRVMHNHHWFRQWLVTRSAPRHYLNRFWNMVDT